MNPKRMNIIDIIIRRAPKNPRLAELEARLRSLEESGLPLPDVADFIESLDLVDRNELESALAEYLPVDYDFTSLIDSLSLVTQNHLDNALANYVSSYVENALAPYATSESLNTLATKSELNTEVQRLDSKIDSLDFSGFATKQELNDAVEGIDFTGFATWTSLNTEVARLDAKIDSIDLSGLATTQELNAEISRLEAEIEALRRNPSGLPEYGHEMKLSDFGDIVLVYGERYFAVTPSEYNTERFPLEDYKPIGFVAYPARWPNSGGLSTRVLAFNAVSSNLWFRGTNDAFVFPELTDFWTGTSIDESMAGLEKMHYIVSEAMNPEYLTAAPSNEASADNFPAFAAAWQYNPLGERFSNTNWYIPSYGEVEQVNYRNETLRAILYDFIDKTGDAVISGKINAFSAALMTSSIMEKPEHAASGYDGWYWIIDSATNPVSDGGHAFTAASEMRPMIRLI